MPSGTWAFLHEWAIYEYMMYRFSQNCLRVRHVINNGKPEMKDRWLKILYLKEVKDSTFPDIKGMRVSGDSKGERVAEVKYLTSLFKYHKSIKHQEDYQDFISKQGCIVVLKHDYISDEILEDILIDVYELDLVDFISYAKENFVRLLNRQIKSHDFVKTWLMIQSKNFNELDDVVLPARHSGRWCPSDNLTGFDLSIGDKVIFIKTSGSSKQKVNTYWSRYNVIYDKWLLEELFVGQVTSPIKSRGEYCVSKNYPIDTDLWYDETEMGKSDKRVTQRKTKGIRWKRVFEFKEIVCLTSLGINLNELNNKFPQFVQAIREIYVGPVSREISSELYTAITEYISMYINRENLEVGRKPDISQCKPLPPYIQNQDNTSIH